MASWRKVITSGSDANLKSLVVSQSINATSITGSLLGIATTASYLNTLDQNIVISTGSVTMPNRPAFKVRGNSGALLATNTAGGLILSGTNLRTPEFNQGSCFNQSTGIFTAPIAGLYQVNLVVRAGSNNNTTINQAIVWKSGSTTTGNIAEVMVEYNNNTSMNHAGGSTITYLAVGDTLKAAIAVGTCSFDSNDNFSVAYIG